MARHADTRTRWQQRPRLTRRDTLIAGLTLAFGASSLPSLTTAQTPAPEVDLVHGNPGRSNYFDEPGPRGDPVVVSTTSLGYTNSLGNIKFPQNAVVADGMILVGTPDGLVAFSESTGEQRWISDGTLTDSAAWTYTAGVGYVDGIVFTGSEFGVLFGLDAESGEKVWEVHDVAVMAQPTYADGLLYVPSDRNQLIAVEAATGNVVWSTETDDALFRWPAYADGRVHVFSWDLRIHTYDSQTGAWIWTYEAEAPFQCATNFPVVANGLIYSKEWDPNVQDREWPVAIDAASGEMVWRQDALLPKYMRYHSASATTVYLPGDPDPMLYAVDAFTGELQWQANLGSTGNWWAYIVEDTVYIDTTYFPGGTVAIDNAVSVLHAFDARDGTPRWTLPLDNAITHGIDVSDGKLYFATHAGTLYVIGGTESGAVPMQAASATPAVIGTPATPGPLLGPGFDAATVELLWTAPPEAGLVSPVSAAINRQGDLSIVDGGNNTIATFDADGVFTGSWDGGFRFGTDDVSLGGIAFDDAGNAYVSDSGNHRIQVFAADRTFVTMLGTEGNGPGQFLYPVAIVDQGAQQLIVADSGNGRIQILALDGTYLDQWGAPGDQDGQFRQPQAIAIGPDATVYVADPAARRIQHFTAGGTFLGDIGTPDDLGEVTGIAVDKAGIIHVASPSRGVILVYGPDGVLWGTVSNVAGAGELGSPRQVLIDSRSDLYVLTGGDAGGRVLKLGFPPPPPSE